MHAKYLIAPLLVLLFPALYAHAQWRGVHATMTTTETITGRNGQVRTDTTTSEYYRSTSGSELTITVMRTPDGQAVRKFAELYDAEEPAQYDLNYNTKTAYLMVRMRVPRPLITDRSAQHPELQHAKYQGFDCVLVPVMLSDRRIGTYWVDDKDDLIVKKDITLPGSHTVTALSNIDLGWKNDPNLFRIPAGFAIDTTRTKATPNMTFTHSQ